MPARTSGERMGKWGHWDSEDLGKIPIKFSLGRKMKEYGHWENPGKRILIFRMEIPWKIMGNTVKGGVSFVACRTSYRWAIQRGNATRSTNGHVGIRKRLSRNLKFTSAMVAGGGSRCTPPRNFLKNRRWLGKSVGTIVPGIWGN